MESECQDSRNKIGENGVDIIFREKIENLSADVHVLHITPNLVNSRRCQSENGIEMDIDVKRTCRAFRTLLFNNYLAKSRGI